jgi:tetratricopeptide (TPR) repeat protein
LVAGLPDPVMEQVLQRAEGVPLSAVETIRMLVDRGQLLEREGVLTVAGALGPLEIPDTLHALIASRLDGASPADRALLQDAAVLGQTFSVPALAAVTGRDATDLAAPLRDLVRKELLALDSDPRSPERGQYGFVQGLIREVAYGTLAKPERRAKHLAVARYFETLADDELVGVVATHYAEAYRATPNGSERGALANQAREWLALAGRRALDLGSPEPALGYVEQALALAEDLPGRATLLDLAGEAARRTDAPERAVTYLEAAVTAHQSASDADAAGLSTARLAAALGVLGRYSVAIARVEQAMADLGETGSERTRADLAATVALLHSGSGAPVPALACSETALTLAERLDDTELLGRAIGAKAQAMFSLGRHQEAVILARGQMALAETSGSLIDQARARNSVYVYVSGDDPAEALSLSLEAARLTRRAGHRSLETGNFLNAAEFAILLGRWDDARAALTALGQRELTGSDPMFLACCEAMLAALSGDTAPAVEQLAAGGDPAVNEGVALRTTYLRARAVVSLAAGDIETAHREAAAAVAADPSGFNTPAALAVQMRSALWLGDAAKAREALVGMQGFRGRWMAAARLTGEAGVAALEGQHDEAATAYPRALDAWRALDSPLDLALCALDRAVLRGPRPGAADEDDEARAILTELGAHPFLDRLDRASEVVRVAG